MKKREIESEIEKRFPKKTRCFVRKWSIIRVDVDVHAKEKRRRKRNDL